MVIRLTKMNGQEIWVNADLVEVIEETPDTIVGLTTGKRIIVTEPLAEVVARVVEYQRLIRQPLEAREDFTGPQGPASEARGV